MNTKYKIIGEEKEVKSFEIKIIPTIFDEKPCLFILVLDNTERD